ncbi:MAG: DnaD domain protein [Oscillospiraceae bacterium]|nr:DnaD domain protein [Oscillospiraceae bacterium]
MHEENEGEQISFGENGENENSVGQTADLSEDNRGDGSGFKENLQENICAAAGEKDEKSCGEKAVGEAAGEKKKRVNVISVPSRKSVLPAEIAERIEKSGEVAFMFKTAEAELKRVLTFDDQRTLLWIHDHLGMSADVVVMIVAYCCRKWGASMKKIEDTAVGMYEREIVTHESVNRELAAMEQRSSYEGKIKAKLGIQTVLTPRQKEYVEEWCGKGISVELVAKAYYITMETKGKADFRYMGGILKKWYDAGVTTTEAADGFDDREKSAAKPAAVKQAGKRDKSNGNAAPSYDLAAILADD